MDIVSLKYDYLFRYLMQNPLVRRHFVSDVLDIPTEEIRSVRLASPFLWKRFFRQKQGILDILLLLNGDTKINIELQIKIIRYWDRRSLFYLSKTFTEDLLFGEKYTKLKRCVSVSILDFNLSNDPDYHRVYRLRDKNGDEFTDLLEVHIVELQKKLSGTERMDDWIRIFNAETEEELDMIKTENPGILEAIREIKLSSAGKVIRALYDAHMKEIRDRNARDDYVREEGIAIGETRGRAEGWAEGELQKVISLVRKKISRNMSPEEIADMLEEDINLITQICHVLKKYPDLNDEEIRASLQR
ncbi:Rpn family recombination-promoting nuclease/putative transposase [Acetatifactor muris]|uniref:PD-(D/E)XK nuclease family transposase n=1 Tax=Acetatifactor muris TaxID=879566 RepID=A0A2K4ZDS9_9FIRM|nr:Rpn family recombination-promoting nuclease/putative transposase [Acetatifactor muris]MCR2046802.1 Rpn family recombination-promoting nuclease/putative transposase [Acetatifactor muris]SOY28612.1 PD-(D/E)XK nuclease family transposase [Acetatifactor muris]